MFICWRYTLHLSLLFVRDQLLPVTRTIGRNTTVSLDSEEKTQKKTKEGLYLERMIEATRNNRQSYVESDDGKVGSGSNWELTSAYWALTCYSSATYHIWKSFEAKWPKSILLSNPVNDARVGKTVDWWLVLTALTELMQEHRRIRYSAYESISMDQQR